MTAPARMPALPGLTKRHFKTDPQRSSSLTQVPGGTALLIFRENARPKRREQRVRHIFDPIFLTKSFGLFDPDSTPANYPRNVPGMIRRTFASLGLLCGAALSLSLAAEHVQKTND